MKFDVKKIWNLIIEKKIILIIFAIIFILAIVFGLISSRCTGVEKLVKIEKGMGSDETAQKLKDEEIIKSKWLFVFYAWMKGYGNHLQAGEYLLNSKMGIPKVAKIIANGEVNENYVKVTIPEGWDIQKIEARLKENNVINKDAKISIENEGYLFPDTYYFYKNSSLDTVIKKMQDNFNQKVGRDTKYDILKMASILEKEVKSDEDRAIVSGIFWKRIKNNIALQSCATIAYILGVEKKQYSYEDTRIKSAYNTYINLGLPPTPINNPGLSAINAALFPKQTDYMYFLSASDGTTIYSKTFEEHNANKAKYLK
jgi:UPF0755 protein